MYLHNMNIQIPTFTVDMGILLQKGHLMEIKLSLSIMLANWVLLLTYVKVDFLIFMHMDVPCCISTSKSQSTMLVLAYQYAKYKFS